MAQTFYWSGDFVHEDKVHRFGILIKFNDASLQREISLSLIRSLAGVGYIYQGNSTIEEVKDDTRIPS